ncbi:TetR/AcrR family transcriptional regulator [Streptomyces sp. NBC_01808]|uniref:TetR/AcrR family transcriptional regulator n=1 Tax=Streptomyces sp. NBC_01808 TaxID=2975947 RepID=UPI002DD9FC2A|nr:TetR/AcrR family transcriptional regulator [Streptomyces sp. NBC_01808]WSA38009.1 TetR/AcrR family transcriptional regulator [Streptomyces sp. NBC_01808]
MRPSSRTQLLEAAVRVVERAGITALTLDAVAAEAGLTKPGLMYHFPNRDALLLAIQRHLTETLDEHLRAELGKPFEEATARERAAAYVRCCGQSGGTADFVFMVASATRPELARIWDEFADRWAPEPPGPDPDPEAVDLFLARVAADGLWLFHATAQSTLGPEVEEAVRRRLAALTDPAS